MFHCLTSKAKNKARKQEKQSLIDRSSEKQKKDPEQNNNLQKDLQAQQQQQQPAGDTKGIDTKNKQGELEQTQINVEVTADSNSQSAIRKKEPRAMDECGENAFIDSDKECWIKEPMSIIVLGATGDLAKKKTYPSLFELFLDYALSVNTIIVGYGRSSMTSAELAKQLRPYLLKHGSEEQVDKFLDLCIYRHGGYDSEEAFSRLSKELKDLHGLGKNETENRVFYKALPPSVFLDTAKSISRACMTKTGFNRVIIEKPFGYDTESATKLIKDLHEFYPDEEMIYRIDHYLGKEMVQNIVTLRFGNTFLEPLWNREHISSVLITFKEDIGTYGRGGYFDKSGIIRDVMQNHLMQVLSIFAMEPPIRVAGKNYSNYVRDEKVKLLSCVEPWTLDKMVLGQYVGNGKEPSYLDDESVPRGSKQATFACAVFYIHNRRWEGVPFIMKAGKALDERKAEVRVQFKAPPGAATMFDMGNAEIPRNELVLRLQPDEAIYMKTNVKEPGLTTSLVQSELNLTYKERHSQRIYDAYTRLILDVLRGKQATFVRDDELITAWDIVTPVLEKIEAGEADPIPYEFGSRGPQEADDLIESVGFVRNELYSENWKAKR